MALFDNSDIDEFLLFVRKFQMALEDSGSPYDRTKIHYLFTLLHGEAIRQIYTLCVEVGSTTTTHLKHIILGLSTYFTPIHSLSRKKCTMRRRTRNPRELKVINHASRIIEIN